VRRPFQQVDVFASEPYPGNPVAVVLESAGPTVAQMQRFAHCARAAAFGSGGQAAD
jgi:predicted PhzF superfamily epimerase YddE/YHI9